MSDRTMIYLDYNASAPLRPEAKAAMQAAWEQTGNPASVHAFGRAARAMVEAAREEVAHSAGFSPDDVIFTSGGVEGNATVLGIANHLLSGRGARVFASATSHSSILKALPEAGSTLLLVHPSGVLDLDAVAGILDAQISSPAQARAPFLVSVEWVNNETGVIQPVDALAELVRRRGGLLHLDGVQALGKLDVAAGVARARPHFLTLSAYKIGGPQGVGALLIRSGAPFSPFLTGGQQEQGRRAGTVNVAGVVGFAAALRALSPLDPAWREEMEELLLQTPGSRIAGREAPRVANTTALMMSHTPGQGDQRVRAETLLMQLDLSGFAISGGAACSSGTTRPSHVLQAMGVSDAEQQSAVRISFGWASRRDDLLAFAQRWTEAVRSAINQGASRE